MDDNDLTPFLKSEELATLGTLAHALKSISESMRAGFKKRDARIVELESRVAKLTQQASASHKQLAALERKQS